MKYLVEPIGAVFDQKARNSLATLFSSRADEGYELHTVFQVSQPGCLGMGQPSQTYLAVYRKRD